MKLRKGDVVKVIRGAEKDKTGTISKTLPALNQVVIDGINVRKRHMKPTQKMPRGGIIEKTMPIQSSKVALLHPDKKGKTSRIGYSVGKDGKKVRVYRQAGNKEIGS